jgi:hypothetical protein
MAKPQDSFFTNFRENKDGQVEFVGKYMEVYVPLNYFESKFASYVDDKIETLGIFLVRVYQNEEKKGNAINHVYKLPSLILTRPSDTHKQALTVNGKTSDYLVMKYYKGDIFLYSTTIIQSKALANQYINFYHNGKLPDFLSYDDSIKIEIEATQINKLGFPVPSVLLECMASEIYRNKDDLSKPFRFSAAEDVEDAGKYDFKMISVTQIPTYTSTFASVTFEDIDYQLIASVNKTKYNREEIISPVEKTIKY